VRASKTVSGGCVWSRLFATNQNELVIYSTNPKILWITRPVATREARQELLMARRICDVCGKDRDVSGGKTCEKGHFICKDDVYSGVIIISEKAHCPICKKPLR
jgi:hypothetical protein